MTDSATVVSRALKRLHGLFQERLADPQALSFRPGDGWNSTGVLIKHVLLSEQRMLAQRFGGRTVRETGHDQQFSEEGTDPESLRRLLDETDALSTSVLESATDAFWNAPSQDFQGNPIVAGDWAWRAMTHGYHHEGQMAVLDRLRKERAAV